MWFLCIVVLFISELGSLLRPTHQAEKPMCFKHTNQRFWSNWQIGRCPNFVDFFLLLQEWKHKPNWDGVCFNPHMKTSFVFVTLSSLLNLSTQWMKRSTKARIVLRFGIVFPSFCDNGALCEHRWTTPGCLSCPCTHLHLYKKKKGKTLRFRPFCQNLHVQFDGYLMKKYKVRFTSRKSLLCFQERVLLDRQFVWCQTKKNWTCRWSTNH